LKNTIAIVLISLILTGCLGFSYQKELIDNYYLIACDVGEQMNLSYNKDGGSNYGTLVSQTVFEAKWNDRFIVIKTHPENLRESLKYAFYLQYVSKLGISNNYAEADSLAEIKTNVFMETRNIYGTNKNEYRHNLTLYYLLDTKNQGQIPLVFLEEEELNKAMEEKRVGKLTNTEYFDYLDKKEK
jgi:hypothetical protein